MDEMARPVPSALTLVTTSSPLTGVAVEVSMTISEPGVVAVWVLTEAGSTAPLKLADTPELDGKPVSERK